MIRQFSHFTSILACLVLSATAINAHELILKPDRLTTQDRETLEFEILSTHQFMQPEEMEAEEIVEAALFQDGQILPLTIQEDPTANRLEGVVSLTDRNPAYLLAHRLGAIWSMTPEGMQEGTRTTLPEVEWSAKYEKFAKTLINATQGDRTYNRPVGQLLEIVPMDNPANLQPGDDLIVQILYKGQPLDAEVKATYDGFSDTPSTYAYFTETMTQGLAKIRMISSGIWMVRVQHTDNVQNEDYDRHVLRSVLVFEVR
ncbi:MAG: DUF4198 domain-containing protein [Cyanobacteria bacterium P01_E01_bin.42]